MDMGPNRIVTYRNDTAIHMYVNESSIKTPREAIVKSLSFLTTMSQPLPLVILVTVQSSVPPPIVAFLILLSFSILSSSGTLPVRRSHTPSHAMCPPLGVTARVIE